MAPKNLTTLAEYRQFILWRTERRGEKTTKVPIDYRTLKPVSIQDSSSWLSFAEAVQYCELYGPPHGLGFVFTRNDPFFFLDIDGALSENGTWSDLASNLTKAFSGAFIEVSQSGKGLHIIGTYQNLFLDHMSRNREHKIELYTAERFVALGYYKDAVGDSGFDHSQNLNWLIENYFSKAATSPETAEGPEWTTEPNLKWAGPECDEKLLEKALLSKSAANVFSTKASFADLWSGNSDVLSRVYNSSSGDEYDRSLADAALAQHLAFWTGGNCERMQNLMLRSELKREKWEVHRKYLFLTITGACRKQDTYYNDGSGQETEEDVGPKLRGTAKQVSYAQQIRSLKFAECEENPEALKKLSSKTSASFWIENQNKSGLEIVSMLTPTENYAQIFESLSSVPVPLEGYQYLSATAQAAHFEGCVYVEDLHRVFTKEGSLVKSEQFNATYGGYEFQLNESGDKTTRKAFEAFTESQLLRFPKAQGLCFRPALAKGALLKEEGRILVNTYVPLEIPVTQADVSPFLNHLNLVLPNKKDQQILLAYMAACVQHKGVKFQWCPLLQGAEGNGKTLFTRCVAYALGRRYTHYPKAADIDNKFNGWLVNKLFIGVEDIYVPAHRLEVLETLKPMITGGDGLEIQAKGADQVTADICANFMLNSNHKDAMRTTLNDRRFSVFFTAQQTAVDISASGMSGEYFPKLYSWLKNEGGYSAVAGFLAGYPIPQELNPAGACHRAPETSSTMEAVKFSLGAIEQEILEAVEENRIGFAGGWISSMALDRLLNNLKYAQKLPRNKRHEALRSLGYEYHPGLKGGRVTTFCSVDGGKPRLYLKVGHIAANLVTGPEILKAYQDSQKNSSTDVLGNPLATQVFKK